MIRRLLMAGAAIVMVAGLLWLVFGHDDAATPRLARAVPTATAPLTATAATQLESELMSHDDAMYRLAWAQSIMPPMSPNGTKVSIDVATFQARQGYGKVDVAITLPGKLPQTWRLLLQYKNGRWLIYTIE